MKQCLKVLLVELGSDHADLSRNFDSTDAHIAFSRNIVKIQPCAIAGWNHTFCTEDRTIFFLVLKFLQNMLQLLLGVGCRCLKSPAGKDIIRVMVVVIMVVTAAGTILPMFMVMIMSVMVVMLMVVMSVMVMMMLMIVMSVVIVMLIVVMMMSVVIVMIMSVMVMMLMVVMSVMFMVIVVMMMSVVIVMLMVIVVMMMSVVVVMMLMIIMKPCNLRHKLCL